MRPTPTGLRIRGSLQPDAPPCRGPARRTATSSSHNTTSEVPEASPPTPSNLGPELLRRGLLVLVTALIVARPLIPGEDAGRLLLFTGAGNQVLTFLWIAVAVGWAAWRAWSQEGLWRFTLVEVGLFGLAILSFFSAQDAAFKHPAWLLAWEWVGVLVAFCLVRQLARSPRENLGLFSAILATGVSVAAFAIYQKAVPPVAPTVDPTLLEIFGPDAEPPPADGVTSTFGKAGTLMTYLRLLAPALLIGLFLRFRPPLCWIASAGGAALLICATATPERIIQWAWVAGIAAVIVAAGVLLRKRRSEDRPWDARVVVGAVLLILATVALDPKGPAGPLLSGLGVGPGNYGRELIHLKMASPSAAVRLEDLPENPLSAVGATTGVVALFVLLLALAAFYYSTRVAWWLAPPPAEPEETPRRLPALGEFYAGGILGLTLAVGLTLDPYGTDLFREGAEAAGRSLVWFASFALLSGAVWTPRAIVGAAAAGIGLTLLPFGDILSPSVALPMWVLAAVALNLVGAGWTWDPRHWLALALPMPLLTIVALAYLMLGLYPSVSSGMEVASARRYYEQWRSEVEPEWKTRLKDAKTPEDKMAAGIWANRYVSLVILRPIGQAVISDPGNPYPLAESAYWAAKRWQIFAGLKDSLSETWPPRQEDAWKKDVYQSDTARAQAVASIQGYDPKGHLASWSQYQTRAFIYAPQLTSLKKPLMSEDEQKQLNKEIGSTYERSARALHDLIKTDPAHPNYRDWRADLIEKALKVDAANPQLHQLLAEIAITSGDLAKAKEEAREALSQNEKEASPRRKLSDEQRKQIQTWLSEKAGG